MVEDKKSTCTPAKKIKEEVRKHYGSAITKKNRTCCCSPGTQKRIVSLAELAGYGEKERSQVPEEAYLSSFGCGNPMIYTDVKAGDMVLDLGSGAGLDVLLASKKVGPTGKVIGLDMTPEMIEKARENAAKAGAHNVEFRLGEMENMPVQDKSVDWIISNCVINLSPDKEKVFQEAFRVLKPGGKMVVSDIVAEGIPEDLRDLLWASCVGGAVDETAYLQIIKQVGFEDIRIVGRLDYDREMINGLVNSGCLDLPPEVSKMIEERGKEWDAKISSIKVSARKKAVF